MNKLSNKKWIIIGSVILILILVSSMGIGAIIGYTTKKDDDYIKFYIAGNEYSPSKYELDLGTIGSSDEEKALIVEAQFLSYAIFGITNINDEDDIKNEAYSAEYLLKQNDEWNTSYQIYRSTLNQDNPTLEHEIEKNILDIFVRMKFFNETQNSSVTVYLNDLVATSTNPKGLLAIINDIEQYAIDNSIPPTEITGTDIINYSNELFNKELFEALISDYSYYVDVLTDIYTYIYLWQTPIEYATYDYNLTKELAYSKPSITWSMKYKGGKFERSYEDVYPGYMNFFEEMSTVEYISIYEDDSYENYNTNESSYWNEIYFTLYEGDYLIDRSTYNDSLDIYGNKYKGYQGITFGTSAGSGIDETWTNSENIWDYQEFNEIENDIPIQTITSKGVNHSDIMNNTNIYVPNYSETGAIITDEIPDNSDPLFPTKDNNRSIYLYNQMTPYIFKKPYEDINGDSQFENATFSLFSIKDGDTYTPYDGNPFDETTEIKYTYIFDEWFSSSDSNLTTKEEEKLSLNGEIYLIEALIQHNSNLEEQSINYWQDKGFYIELSGSYEDELIGFIPSNMIKE